MWKFQVTLAVEVSGARCHTCKDFVAADALCHAPGHAFQSQVLVTLHLRCCRGDAEALVGFG